MGCCYPKLISPEEAICEGDGKLMFTFKTGGLTLLRGSVQQNLPAGTLFITDKKIIHCTKCFSCHRLEFRLSKLKELESSLTFGNHCQVTIPCCRGLPNSFMVFKTKFDRKLHSVAIKLKDSDEVVGNVEKLIKKYRQRLSVIKEEEKEVVKHKLDSSSSTTSTV